MAAKETMAEMTSEEAMIAPTEWEFETVAEESGIKVVFEEPGDEFLGQYEGMVTIQPEGTDKDGKPFEPFDLYNFRARDGRLYSVNSSFKIEQGMRTVGTDQWVRITYTKDIPVSGRPEPLKDFRIQVRK